MEDKAILGHIVATAAIKNFYPLPQNIQFCGVPDPICFGKIELNDLSVHGFQETYTSDLIDKNSQQPVYKILANLVKSSFDELNPSLPTPIKITLDAQSIKDIGGVVNGNVAFITGYNGGKAAKFNGVSDPASIRIPNSDNIKFDTGATFDMWVRLDSLTGMDGWGRTVTNGAYAMALLAKSHDIGGSAFMANAMNSGTSTIWTATSNSSWTASCKHISYGSPIALGEWRRVTYTISPTSGINGYLNKKLVWTCPDSRPTFDQMNARDLFIGKYSDSWYPLNGAIQDISIYKKALTSEQVAIIP